jgi:hypothetical protein
VWEKEVLNGWKARLERRVAIRVSIVSGQQAGLRVLQLRAVGNIFRAKDRVVRRPCRDLGASACVIVSVGLIENRFLDARTVIHLTRHIRGLLTFITSTSSTTTTTTTKMDPRYTTPTSTTTFGSSQSSPTMATSSINNFIPPPAPTPTSKSSTDPFLKDFTLVALS